MSVLAVLIEGWLEVVTLLLVVLTLPVVAVTLEVGDVPVVEVLLPETVELREVLVLPDEDVALVVVTVVVWLLVSNS